MDLFADHLLGALKRNHSNSHEADRIQPQMLRRATRLSSRASKLGSGERARRFFLNADRVANRFWDYPRHLRRIRGGYDVFHVVDHGYAQLVHELPAEHTVVTCHDLEAFRSVLDPAEHARSKAFTAMTARMLSGLVKAAHVTCVSTAVRDEILRYGLLPADRLSVVLCGVHPAYSPDPDLQADAEATRLLGPANLNRYDLLHVGSTIPRKRIDVLLEVFASVRRALPGARLIRVGGPFTAAQERLIAKLELRGSILVLPFVERPVLAAVYRRAAVVLHPSDAEGFGMPLVEAMASGARVVASDLPVLREIGGEAPAFCAVADISGWTSTVVELLNDRIAHSDDWLNRRLLGIAHAGTFSWAEYARRMTLIYQKLLQ